MLILVPTVLEAEPLKRAGLAVDVIGFGPVEAALGALRALKDVQAPVFLVGIGGAYPQTNLFPGQLVLATEEHFGDLAACYSGVEGPVGLGLQVPRSCDLRNPLLEKVYWLLRERGFPVESGPFVTVCCATKDQARASRLGLRYAALVENMEGFAVARVAQERGVPLIELRAVSNLLARPDDPWQVEGALKTLKEALVWLKQHL